MIDVELAALLRAAGLSWTPQAGDQFALPGKDLDGEVFVISTMTIEIQHFPTGPVIGFNGTTEWALDSVQEDEALWLPSEEQLRDLLQEYFVALTRTPQGEFEVRVRRADGEQSYTSAHACDAYALAALGVLQQNLASSTTSASVPQPPN